jgi:hypothetical protein
MTELKSCILAQATMTIPAKACLPSDVVALDYKLKREKPVKMLHMDAAVISSLFK